MRRRTIRCGLQPLLVFAVEYRTSPWSSLISNLGHWSRTLLLEAMWIHWLKLMELSSQANLHFRCKSWLPMRSFIFSRLYWEIDFNACELLIRHLIQGSKKNEQDNCSTTASLTCTLKHHSLAGCRHHQMLVPVQNAADCTDFWTRWPTLTAWCLMPCTRRVILLWSETSVNCWGNFLKLHVHDFFVGCAGFPSVFILC